MPEGPATSEQPPRLGCSLKFRSRPQPSCRAYDFIVVGSGSAGSVLADKLSASGRFSVLVLEAGGTDRRFYVQMPLGYGKTFFDPAVNWNYKAEPDPGLAGNADHWPRGKLLGGSSSINAMVWIRGAREDFDAWAAPAIRAGAMTICCRPSRRSRTMRPARTHGAAPAVRCISPTARTPSIR